MADGAHGESTNLIGVDRMHVDVGSIDDFEEGRFSIVVVDAKELGILRMGDEFFAVRNVCAHVGAPVCLGTVAPNLGTEEDGETLVLDRSRPTLICGWHRWEYDVRSGRQLIDRTNKLKTYPVTTSDKRVLVEMPSRVSRSQPQR
jgi:nitrite reductase (NADH) small subunit